MTNTANPDLTPYGEVEHHVWVQTPTGGLFAYRMGLPFITAKRWAEAWNETPPEDQPGSRFFAVKATTSFEVI